jgi:hypothetical protein
MKEPILDFGYEDRRGVVYLDHETMLFTVEVYHGDEAIIAESYSDYASATYRITDLMQGYLSDAKPDC